jgi:hypothetical protein
MKLKIYKRGSVLINTIIYLALNFVFLHIVTCLLHDVSSFNISYLTQNLARFRLLLVIIGLSSVSVWMLKRGSLFFFLLTTAIVFFETAVLLVDEFNKLILFLLFFYLVISYYFYQIWNSEINEPYYHPNFRADNMFSPMLYRVKVELQQGEKAFNGYLSNWSLSGLFVVFDDEVELERGLVKITLKHNNTDFSQPGVVVSMMKTKRGAGLKIVEEPSSQEAFTWYSYNEILEEKGLKPEFLL